MKHKTLRDTFPHSCDRNRTGGSSAGPRVLGNKTAQRLLLARGTGRQQTAPPHTSPLAPTVSLAANAPKLCFTFLCQPRVPALDNVFPELRLSH